MSGDGEPALAAASAAADPTSRHGGPGGPARRRESSQEAEALRAPRPTFTSVLRMVDQENAESEQGMSMDEIRERLARLRQEREEEDGKSDALFSATSRLPAVREARAAASRESSRRASRASSREYRIADAEDPEVDTTEDHAWYDAYADHLATQENLGNDQELPKRFPKASHHPPAFSTISMHFGTKGIKGVCF